jgi:hypothetical protein
VDVQVGRVKRRYPFEPLEEIVARQLRSRGIAPTLKGVADELGEEANLVRRARANGLNREQTERLAAKVGYHPASIWPEILDHDIEDLPVCASDDCDERFVPRNRASKYCSPRCSRREVARRYRARHPEVVKAQAARRRARYAADAAKRQEQIDYQARYRSNEGVRRRKNAYRRRYYAENREREIARQRAYDARRAAERRQQSEAA